MASEHETTKPETVPSDEGQQKLVSNRSQFVSIPRWLIYFQAALLGVVATTFFIFGLMVGSLTSGNDQTLVKKIDCRIAGKVTYRSGDAIKPDSGAVVFFLPKNRKPEERASASSVSPTAFQALDNPGIAKLHQLGGAVVRADQSGSFEVIIDGREGDGIDYYFLVVSRNQPNSDEHAASKRQVAAIGTFFMPVERLLDDRAFHWSAVNARSREQKVPIVEF